MPDAKIIQLVRAPIDVFLSRKRMEPAMSFITCLKDLELSYLVAVKQARLNPNSFLLRHYEALCSNPHVAISGIAGFLGIEHLPCLYTPTVWGKPAQVNSSFIPDLPAGGILNSQVYLHDARDLQNQEAKLLSAYLFKPAAQLGYALKPIGVFSKSLVKFKLHLQACMAAVLLKLKHYR